MRNTAEILYYGKNADPTKIEMGDTPLHIIEWLGGNPAMIRPWDDDVALFYSQNVEYEHPRIIDLGLELMRIKVPFVLCVYPRTGEKLLSFSEFFVDRYCRLISEGVEQCD